MRSSTIGTSPSYVGNRAAHIHLASPTDRHLADGGAWFRPAFQGEALRHHAMAALKERHDTLLETADFLPLAACQRCVPWSSL